MEALDDCYLWNPTIDDWVFDDHYRFVTLSKVPRRWLEAASRVPRKATLMVALSIWWVRTLTKKNPIVLATKAVEIWGIDAKAKGRALHDLETAGLITVDRKRGRFPVVTILDEADLCDDVYPSH